MNVKYFTAITLTQSKNYLHFDLMQKLNNCLVNDRALGDSFQSFQTAFTSAFVRLDEVLQPSRKSLLTPEIQRVDNERVKLWRVVKNFAKEQETMPSQAALHHRLVRQEHPDCLVRAARRRRRARGPRAAGQGCQGKLTVWGISGMPIPYLFLTAGTFSPLFFASSEK